VNYPFTKSSTIARTFYGRILQCLNMKNHVCPLHAGLGRHAKVTFMRWWHHTHMHWTIYTINPAPSSETQVKGIKKDTELRLLWRHVFETYINLICTTYVIRTGPYSMHELTSAAESYHSDRKREMHFLVLLILSTSQTHLFSSQTPDGSHEGKMIQSHWGVCGKGHSHTHWAELFDSWAHDTLMIHLI